MSLSKVVIGLCNSPLVSVTLRHLVFTFIVVLFRAETFGPGSSYQPPPQWPYQQGAPFPRNVSWSCDHPDKRDRVRAPRHRSYHWVSSQLAMHLTAWRLWVVHFPELQFMALLCTPHCFRFSLNPLLLQMLAGYTRVLPVLAHSIKS